MPVSSKFSSANFLKQFRNGDSKELNKLSAVQFMQVWDHYDTDGNGLIEDEELDGFLREFVASVNSEELEVTEETLAELKGCLLETYDDNKDGKIDIRELAQLLPMEENFLLLFRFDNPLDSSVEFMKVRLTNNNVFRLLQTSTYSCSCGISMTRMAADISRLMN